MERKIIDTNDGSHSISIPAMNVTYHSVHGAMQESQHVFIKEGLFHLINQSALQQINIFEMGFGTGLNALLTIMATNLPVYYESIEVLPLEKKEYEQLNYCNQLNRPDLQPVFEKLHTSPWDTNNAVADNFTLYKKKTDILNYSTSQHFNLIYYDAFAPSAQPELWTKKIFDEMFSLLHPKGVLVTYCSKGDVRRAMQAAGFIVEKIPGPPGKREMIRASRK
jgi:tRNA U34 5-methylaminomethyl-2-thiouridine-forming methyltransferase MnmC